MSPPLNGGAASPDGPEPTSSSGEPRDRKQPDMTRESRLVAGVILVLVPAVAFGGASLLAMILGRTAGYLDNPVRQDLWRAGHAHAGVLLVLALVALRYVDETRLTGPWLWLARTGVPIAAILMPAGFFLSILDPAATEPNPLIVLVAIGGLFLIGAVVTLGIGLLRSPDAVPRRA